MPPFAGAEIVLDVPALDGPLWMRVAVPAGPDQRHRLRIVAYVIAEAYSRMVGGERQCLWCGESPAEMMLWEPHGEQGPPGGWFCDRDCWLAAS